MADNGANRQLFILVHQAVKATRAAETWTHFPALSKSLNIHMAPWGSPRAVILLGFLCCQRICTTVHPFPFCLLQLLRLHSFWFCLLLKDSCFTLQASPARLKANFNIKKKKQKNPHQNLTYQHNNIKLLCSRTENIKLMHERFKHLRLFPRTSSFHCVI